MPNIERQIRNIFSIYARSQCNEGYKIISGPTRVTVKSKKRYDPYSLIKNIACSIFLVVADILQTSRFFFTDSHRFNIKPHHRLLEERRRGWFLLFTFPIAHTGCFIGI